MAASPTHLLWCDLETTGLEPYKGDKLLEFAFKLTPFSYFVKDSPDYHKVLWTYEKVVHFSRSEASALSHSCPFVYDMHTKNGLLDECAASDVTVEQVEIEVCNFLEAGLGSLGVDRSKDIIIAGSSIHFDRKWLEWFTPDISEALHYRIMDVSSLYPVIEMLGHTRLTRPKAHRAMTDIDRSIGELEDILELIRVKRD